MVIKKCEMCGGSFPASRRSVKYCSDPCRKEANRKHAAERTKSPYEKKEKEMKMDRISEINALARAEGLTYGKYVAREWLKRKGRFF